MTREWSPADLGADLQLWLDAGVGVTESSGAVSAWADQSGNGNDATAPGSTPTFDATGINGKPAIQFSDSADMRLTTVSPLSIQGNDPRHLLVVYKTASTVLSANLPVIWTGGAPGSPGAYFAITTDSAGDPRLQGGGASGDVGFVGFGVEPRVYDVPLLADAWHEGSDNGIAKNDGEHLTATGLLDSDSAAANIGNRPGGDAIMMLRGHVAEILVVSRRLSADDLARARRYLNSKYGIW